MKIFIDRDIYRKEIFSGLGELVEFDHRDFSGLESFFGEIDVLVVRSVTRVDGELLGKFARLKLLLTPTIGIDHIDIRAIEAMKREGRDIGFFHSPGATAPAVGDYTAAAIVSFCDRNGADMRALTASLIGFGNCGKAVKKRLDLLGIECLVLYDPPLGERTGGGFVSAGWDEIFDADIISFHCPLTRADESAHPTFHMAGADFFRLVKEKTVIINTARGGVIDTSCMKEALRAGRINAVLDVFENEPEADRELVELAFIATPHVAGSSFEGKGRAVEMIYNAACAFFGIEPGRAEEKEENPATLDGVKSHIASVSAEFKRLLREDRQGVAGIFNGVRARAMRHETVL